MNKIIKQQLEKLKSVKITFKDSDKTIFIPKTTEIIQEAMEVGNIYLIKLDKKMLNPTTNSTLASNWNGGRVPTQEVYKAELLDIMNNMYKFNGIAVKDGIDLYSENWFGWVPKEYFEILSKIE